MISLKNLKTKGPKKKWDDKWDGPNKVLKCYRGAVVVELPKHIRVNNTFHTSLVQPWSEPALHNQSEINQLEKRNIAGRIAERDDVGNILDKWIFEKILDVHDEDINQSGLTYLIKQKYNDEPSWHPEADLKGCEMALKTFHENNPEKPAPPIWVSPLEKQQLVRKSDRQRRPTWKIIER